MKLSLKSISVLQWALVISIVFHALLLLVRFVDPEGFKRAFQETALDVVLVNGSTVDKPTKAQAIAQANLAGGGDASDHRMVSTPLPRAEQEIIGNSLIERNQTNINTLQQEQRELLAKVRAQLKALPRSDARRNPHTNDGQDVQAQRRQLQKVLAVIERRVELENSRPRKRFLSPATMGSIYALYYDSLRHKIEDRGTRDFPQVDGQKLYGELIMSLLVDHDGRVINVEVVKGSGNKVLDGLASAIATSAGPFGPFSPAMRQDTDQFDVIARFRFTHEQKLETVLQTNQVGSAPSGMDLNDAP